MGKEWLYWRSSGSGSGGSTQKGRRSRGASNEEAPPPGCSMCFQIFDLQVALNQQSPSSSFLKQEPSFLKGLEAPRNSLDLDEERKSVSSSFSSSNMKKMDDQNLNIPVQGIQIRTSTDSKSARVSTSTSRTRRDHDMSSECSSSSPKTPTLVARLMGLDLLPDNNNSPRLSVSNNHPPSPKAGRKQLDELRSKNINSRSRLSNFENYTSDSLSLPETPRISAASRRSDVDHHHRLSLQINKENYDTNRSPGYYARQIVKQVQERVSKKVGHDITNSITRKDDRLVAKYDDQVVLLKPKKHRDDDAGDLICPSKQSSSPRFRLLELKNKPVRYSAGKGQASSHSPRLSENKVVASKIVTKPKLMPQNSPQKQVQQNIQKGKDEKAIPKKKPLQANCDAIQTKKQESFVRSNAIRNKKQEPCVRSNAIQSKKQEPFVRSAANYSTDNKCKRTPLSNQLVSIPTLLPLKKDPSPPPTKLLIKQESDLRKKSTQLSSTWSRSYKPMCNGGTTISSDDIHYYIQTILKRSSGIDKTTPISLAKWYSSSHPLDPSIFHHLELFHLPITTTLTPRCNRKLIFQLVDELLVEILNLPWARQVQDGKELIDTLCVRIHSFPSANCQVLEDIDALVVIDLQRNEEAPFQNIVCEIERDIMEALVHEMICTMS